MANKIDSKQFNFDFFLSDKIKVKNLKDGAIKYGGATKTKEYTYSNIARDEYIKVNTDKNKLSIFIPSTFNIDKKIDNMEYVIESLEYIQSNFNGDNIIYYDTQGSWYSDQKNKIIYEDITKIEFELSTVTIMDIKILQILANRIKKDMLQENVTITINNCMCLV